jgi:hypothetical protein
MLLSHIIRQSFLHHGIIISVFLLCFHPGSLGQKIVSNNYVSAAGLKHLVIERRIIYEPSDSWMYSHHPYFTFFKNKFIAAWSNGLKDEDHPGQRVAFSVSDDFVKWSAPKTLASPSVYKKDTLNVLTAVGFHQFNDTLVA